MVSCLSYFIFHLYKGLAVLRSHIWKAFRLLMHLESQDWRMELILYSSIAKLELYQAL